MHFIQITRLECLKINRWVAYVYIPRLHLLLYPIFPSFVICKRELTQLCQPYCPQQPYPGVLIIELQPGKEVEEMQCLHLCMLSVNCLICTCALICLFLYDTLPLLCLLYHLCFLCFLHDHLVQPLSLHPEDPTVRTPCKDHFPALKPKKNNLSSSILCKSLFSAVHIDLVRDVVVSVACIDYEFVALVAHDRKA